MGDASTEPFEVTISSIVEDEEISVTDYGNDRALVEMDADAKGFASVLALDEDRTLHFNLEVQDGDTVTIFIVDLLQFVFSDGIGDSHYFSESETDDEQATVDLPAGKFMFGVVQDGENNSDSFTSVFDAKVESV